MQCSKWTEELEVISWWVDQESLDGWSRIFKDHLMAIFFLFLNVQYPFAGGKKLVFTTFLSIPLFPTLPKSCIDTNMTESWETGITSGLRHFIVTGHSSVPLWECPSSWHGKMSEAEIEACLVPVSLYGKGYLLYINFLWAKISIYVTET